MGYAERANPNSLWNHRHQRATNVGESINKAIAEQLGETKKPFSKTFTERFNEMFCRAWRKNKSVGRA